MVDGFGTRLRLEPEPGRGRGNPVIEDNMVRIAGESSATSACSMSRAGRVRDVRALLKLAKPGIVLAETATCLAGALLASPSLPGVSRLLLVMLCVALGAGGAAMANCLLEEAGDRLMPRLSARCQAFDRAGARSVRSVSALLMASSLVTAALYVNIITASLIGFTLFAYVFVYTSLLKLKSPFSVLVGGVAGAFPPLVGAASVGSVTAAPLLLAALVYVWQLPHFWFLALRYQDQYHLAGVPVFPLVYGELFTCRLIVAVNGLIIPLSLLIPGYSSSSAACLLTILLLGILNFSGSVWAVGKRSRYRSGFLFSLAYLAMLLATLVADGLFSRF